MVKANIDEVKLKELYLSGLSLKEIALVFHVTPDTIRNRLKALGIYKSTHYNYDTLEITPEKLINYYSNHSKIETLKYFNISGTVFSYLLKSVGYTKPQSARNELRKQTCISKYGVENSSQIEGAQQKRTNTLIKKFGSLENLHKHLNRKSKATKIEKYGSLEAAEAKRIENAKKTYQEKYGKDVEYSFQVPGCIEKINNTKMERYGTLNYNNVPKRKETNLKIHGDPNYNNFDKIQSTLKKHYGEDFQTIMGKKRQEGQLNRSSEEIEDWKNKTKQTMQERYGVDWYCQKANIKGVSVNSRPNKKFKELLMLNGLEEGKDFEIEYAIQNYNYDFKIGKYLIEINPYPTHNVTWGLFGNPKKPDYHIKKSQKALDNGFYYICIWDWVSYEEIMDKILNYSIQSYLIKEPKIFIYDWKQNALVKEENETTVIIYDDGFTYRWVKNEN